MGMGGGIQIDFRCRQDPYKRYSIISKKPNFVVGKGFSLREGTTFKKYLFPAEIRCDHVFARSGDKMLGLIC